MEDLKELKNIAQELTVLYVEDDLDIANTLISYLSKFFKEVVYATNGEDGLKLYKQAEFDLVITDIKMPKMNGLDMSKEIKNMKGEQNIIIISAYSEIENFLYSIKIGIDGYIIKPVDYADMNTLLYKTVKKIFTDKRIVEYKIKQRELLSSVSEKNQELEQYVEALGKVAIVSKTDLNGNITFVNDFFCEVSGYERDELVGFNHNIIRHPDMSKDIFRELWQTIQSGKVWEGNLKNKAKNGEPYYVHVTVVPLIDTKSQIKEYIGIRFLTTKEEMEKREFKKNVMMNYQEFRKDKFNSTKRIQELEQELAQLKNSKNYLEDNSIDNKQKQRQLQSQINYYEKEMSLMKNKQEKLIESYNSNTRNLTQINNKYKNKIQLMNKDLEFYQEEIKTTKNAMAKLEEEIAHQKKIIYDLKDTLKNIVDIEDDIDNNMLNSMIKDLKNIVKKHD